MNPEEEDPLSSTWYKFFEGVLFLWVLEEGT